MARRPPLEAAPGPAGTGGSGSFSATAAGQTNIREAVVVGTGQMGAGIAQVLAQANIPTLLYDKSSQAVEQALQGIEKALAKQVEKGKVPASEKERVLSQIRGIDTLVQASQADIAIEAILENVQAKCGLFRELDGLCKPETVLASNTSSISITKLAAATKRPGRVIGIHFMNPVPLMKLVEIIRGLQTSDETFRLAHDLVGRIGKTSVTAKHDYPGFIVNRILMPMLNEAFFALMEGIASPEEIDTAMKLGTNQPMGPLELADFVGLDTCLAICQVFHTELGEDKYRPCPLLVKYVEAGWLGKKTGRGVYVYEGRRGE